jgi:hypothetical protein
MAARKTSTKTSAGSSARTKHRSQPLGETVEAYGQGWSGAVGGTEEDVKTAEAALGVRIPKDVAELLRTCGAGRPAKPFYFNAQYQREAHLGWIIPLKDLPNRRGLVTQCMVQRQVHHLPTELIPFAMDNGNSDIYCVNAVSGEIIYWIHDTPDDDRALRVAPSLSQFLTALTDPPY